MQRIRFLNPKILKLTYSHIDADGISAASILSLALDRLNINHDVHFTSLDGIPSSHLADLTIFLDMEVGR